MKADLEILARELKVLAEGSIPNAEDAIPPTFGTMLWAEGWLLTLNDLGVTPAPASGDRA